MLRIGRRVWARDFGADILAALSMVTALVLGQYLAGCIILLMLTGGEWLEKQAQKQAAGVLDALARRMPQIAHRRVGETLREVPVAEVVVGETLVVLPHELCPVDGRVIEGRGRMDESYLTGEPFQIDKVPGSKVFSGAINGEVALTLIAEQRAQDSRYAKIMHVLEDAETRRPRLRRLADRIGAYFAPVALTVAGAAWAWSGSPMRFLAVLVIATPCPLLIAVPVAVIGGISLAAKRGIIIKNPAILEQLSQCRTLIVDKTGTLTYGRPAVTEIHPASGFSEEEVLRLAASLERYSKHPLASAILRAAEERGIALESTSEVSEKPGAGLLGTVAGRVVQITGRRSAAEAPWTPWSGGLECLVFIDQRCAAVFRFRDAPRAEGKTFIDHLPARHRISRILLVSGDREEEVRYLAQEVGISEVRAQQTPEEKVMIVRAETCLQPTVFVGDGINDAPALAAATVGIAMGSNSNITSEAADAVILEASLTKVDELFHIGRRMRTIALQSALGGVALSFLGMLAASTGHVPPVAGALFQECIDVAAVLNAVRVAWPPRQLSDCS